MLCRVWQPYVDVSFHCLIDEYTKELKSATDRAEELRVTDLDAAVNTYLEHTLQGKTISPRADDWEVD